ncbi:MAG TPA: radical SAM protein [Methylomirabilota bacterium]|nr:radical SAM protein [Methylomirabilota bacterium]
MSLAAPMPGGCAKGPTPLMDGVVSRTVRRHLPFGVHFDLTYRCNERCVHCYLDHEDYGELTTAEILAVLEQLAEAGTLLLTFSGGEIFLRPDLFEILEEARRRHFDVSLKTNALLVTPQKAARLRELGVRRVQISIYSDDPAVHDAVTKVPGSLERTLAAIPLLQAEGLHVKIACPLMTENLASFRGVLALAERLGVSYIFDPTITPMIDGNAEPLAHRVSGTELLPVLQEPKLRGCRPESVDASALPVSVGSASSSGIEGDAYDDLPCSAGQNTCYISPYGDVYPCVQLPVAAGNLRRERFADIWSGSAALERVRAVRQSQLPVCSACSIRKYCERCPGLALMEGGDLVGAYERACELAEVKARLDGVADAVSELHRRQRATQPPMPFAESAASAAAAR